MTWDNDKSTATDPDNPTAAEQLTATEWDNHVLDQLGRMEYGLLSNRPAATERPAGSLWFDENGRISRTDGNDNWVLDSFGTSANPIPGTSVFTDLDTDTFNQNLQGSSAYLDTTQTIDSGTFTRVAFDTENYDDRGEFDTTTNQWTATDAGTYIIIVGVQFGGFTGSNVALQVMINGGARSYASRQQDAGFSTIRQTLIFNLSAGDTVDAEARQSSGEQQDIIASQSATNITIARIG